MDSTEGIIPPMITPLLSEEKLDLQGLNHLIDHLISGGVHGLFVLGTTGEGPSLNHALRLELVKRVCERVGDRIPVLVGLMDTSYKESVDLAHKAKALGAKAFVVAPPCFFQIDQDELYNFTNQMLDDITLPVYLYNNPGLTKVSFELKTVEKLLTNDNVRGIKDSSGDMIYHQKLQAATKTSQTSLFIGPEELLMESLIMGGNGGVSGGANIFPKLYVNMYNTVTSGNWKKARALQREIMQLSDVVYSGNGCGAAGVINGIKSALNHLGICSDYVARPLNKASEKKSKKIQNWLAEKEASVK
ncbi:MAG: dihydrodipicolinate synthase family protein [Balneolaceae bacterium]|nr:dihydrodipicolinate synthase family protein [Balneolaceae bacterium]